MLVDQQCLRLTRLHNKLTKVTIPELSLTLHLRMLSSHIVFHGCYKVTQDPNCCLYFRVFYWCCTLTYILMITSVCIIQVFPAIIFSLSMFQHNNYLLLQPQRFHLYNMQVFFSSRTQNRVPIYLFVYNHQRNFIIFMGSSALKILGRIH